MSQTAYNRSVIKLFNYLHSGVKDIRHLHICSLMRQGGDRLQVEKKKRLDGGSWRVEGPLGTA